MRKIVYVFIVLALVVISAIFGAIYFFFHQSQSGLNSSVVQNTQTINSPTIFTSFIINVQDWTSPEKSSDTLNRILDIHESYQVPVDIYLDDQIVQTYEQEDPDLLERLKTSDYVSVSYHIRPPTPYYTKFDWLGLDNLNDADLQDVLEKYETSSIDLSTGEPTSKSGGYEYLKNLMGYAPYVVSIALNGDVANALNALYTSMGAKMIAIHGNQTDAGMRSKDLFVRPETIEVKAYEKKTHYSAENILADALTGADLTKTQFMNLKWHENNFYTSGTPFDAVYYDHGDRTKPLSPPFDLSKANDPSITQIKTQDQQDEQWERYEELVKIVSEQPKIYTSVNAKDIYELLSR